MERNLASGEIVFTQHQPGEYCYFVLAGRIALSEVGPTGEELEVGRLGPGEIFGEMALIDGHPRSATARAVEADTRILEVSPAEFLYLLGAQPAFALHVLEQMSARARHGEVKAIAQPFGRTAVGDGYVAEEVAAGVTQLRSRTSSCHCYLFRGPRRTVLVDTGLPSTAEALVRALAAAGVTPGDIDQVILTHEHIDHLGGVASFVSRAEVLAHRLTAVKVELQDEFGMMTAPFGETIAPFPFGAQLEGGELIATGQHALRIYPTPGHSSGSLSLHDENSGLLLAGDLVLQQGALGGIFVGGSPSDSVASLRHLARLKPRLMLPGHGPLVTDPMASLARAIENCGQLIVQSRAQFAALDAASSAGRMVTLFQEFNRRWRPV